MMSFFKVDNEHFYSTFKYPALDNSKHEIRLLRLDAQGPEKHNLISVQLSTAPRFVALSYVCGSTLQHSTVEVDGHSFNAFANLAAAISEVRQCSNSAFPGEEILLWTDQICINQNDDEERSHQVSIMRDIYAHADKTIVRLPASVDPVHRFESWPEYKSWFERQKTKLVLFRYPDEKRLTDSYGYFLPGAADDDFIADTLKAWQDLYAIAASKWWTRAWIFQEFLASPNVYFIVSPFLVPWQDIYDLWKMYHRRSGLFQYWLNHVKDLIEPQTQFWIQRLESNGLTKFCNEGCNYCGAADYSEEFRVQCRFPELCNICDKSAGQSARYSTVRAMNALIRHKFDRHYEGFRIMLDTKENPEYYPARLETLLLQSRFRDTSEARDRVYAYIGLMGDKCSVKPNYREKLNTILTQTAQDIILKSGNLNLLEHIAEVDRPNNPADPLPSWVPAWTKVDWSDPIHRPRMDPFLFGKVSTATPEVAFLNDAGHEGRILETKGLKIDFILRIEMKERLVVCEGNIPGVSYIGSASISPGDEIWTLFGASKLYAFRREGQYVRLLSQVYTAEGLDILRSLKQTFVPEKILIR